MLHDVALRHRNMLCPELTSAQLLIKKQQSNSKLTFCLLHSYLIHQKKIHTKTTDPQIKLIGGGNKAHSLVVRL